MQLQFETTKLPCLHRLKGELQSREETQELRLPENMPDLGPVLGTWGQVLLRGKHWSSRTAELSCGVMAWVLYQPEDGSAPQTVEAWLPVEFSWDLPESDRDGVLQASCLLKNLDARPVTGRKLMVRATVEVCPNLWQPAEAEVYTPGELPTDIRLLEKSSALTLPREAGEKAFPMEETLTLPENVPPLGKLLRYSLTPEVTEQKLLGNKVVFRGICQLHILYADPADALYSCDFQLPFSQYDTLGDTYDQAEVKLLPAVTGLELEHTEGALQLKAGLTCQYTLWADTEVSLVEDAYSPDRPVAVQKRELTLQALAGQESRNVTFRETAQVECRRAVDVSFCPSQPRLESCEGERQAQLAGQFQLLCYDDTDTLQYAAPRVRQDQSLSEPEGRYLLELTPQGLPQAVLGPETVLTAQAVLSATLLEQTCLPMVTALEVGEATAPDPNRPSLILRRAGTDSLWQIARTCGSTVEAIRAANRLTGDPEEDRMLLIPVL